MGRPLCWVLARPIREGTSDLHTLAKIERMQVGIHAAQKNLSVLIKRAERGEEITLTRRGRPVVKLIALPPTKRVLGRARGLIREIDKDWWKPMTNREIEEFYADTF